MKRLLVLFLLCVVSGAGRAQASDWKKAWDETLAAARKEGRVVVAAPPDAEVRQALLPSEPRVRSLDQEEQ